MLKKFKEEDSKGRLRSDEEQEDNYPINPYSLDKIRIMGSKALRRAINKTQVFVAPDNHYIRNRASHTNEVVTNSIILSESLGLNTRLCESIAYAHDLGHCPYGHLTESLLTRLLRDETSNNQLKFHHSLLSVLVLELIERKGNGLNLTYETLEGILYHTTGSQGVKSNESIPNEYNVVMIADKISYLFSDVNDAKRIGLLNGRKELIKLINWFGINQRTRTNKCLNAIIKESKEKGRVSFSEGEVYDKFSELLQLMYSQVYYYYNLSLKSNEQKIKRIIEVLSNSSITDYLKIINLKQEAVIPDKYLLTSLLTDDEVNSLDINNITLKSIIMNPSIRELMPYLLINERITSEKMRMLYEYYGTISDKRALFEKVRLMLN